MAKKAAKPRARAARPKRAAQPKRAARAKRPARSSAPAAAGVAQLVPEKRNELIVRMYRQGLGDCFLLALPAGRDQVKYILVDCGVHKRQTDGPDRLAQVLSHLQSSTNKHIDIIVATHEHADHLSGFVQKGSPFLNDELTLGELWVGWTEKRGDGQADKLRKRRGTAQRVIDKAVEEAGTNAGLAGAGILKRLDTLTSFVDPPDGSVDIDDVMAKIAKLNPNDTLLMPRQELAALDGALGVAAKKKTKVRPSSNELALGLLRLKAGDSKTKFCEPGDMCTVAGVDNLRAYVLGPPRSPLLEQEKPTKIRGATEDDPGGMYKEVYLTAGDAGRALQLSPRFQLNATAVGADLPSNWRYPFPEPVSRPCEFSDSVDVNKGNAWSKKVPPPASTRQFIDGTYFDSRANWRRIDADWLDAVDALALNLASDTNNTSLALAFEWGDPGSGRVLLFAADAQVGNWLSWRDQKYGKDKEKMGVDDLLSRVLLYKVGHHGSHNATVKRDPRDASSDDPNGAPYGLELMSDMIAMIPVDHDAVRKEMPDPWRMPHEPLYRRLREKCRRRVLRSDLVLNPLDQRKDDGDIVPTSTDWTAVPGLAGVRWRRAPDDQSFSKGTKGPLYYDVSIALT